MSVIDLLITVFWGYAVVMVLIFIFIIAVIRAGEETRKGKRKYDIKFRDGEYILTKKKRPRF
jgi:uncharacterized membrane protein